MTASDTTIEGYKNLASAILVQAAKDYRRLQELKRKNAWETGFEIVQKRRKKRAHELHTFFLGQWVNGLIGLSTSWEASFTGEDLLVQLESEGRSEESIS